MSPVTALRSPSLNDIKLRTLAAGHLRATSLGPDHPAVIAAIRWQDMRNSANSAATSVSDFRAFFDHCARRQIDPLAISRSDARLFVAEQSSLDYAPATLARRTAVLRSYFLDLEDEGVVPSNPFYRVKAGNSDPVTPTPALTLAQIGRLVEMSGARTRASVLLALNGGNIHEAAQILGHSSHRMTADLYGHLLSEVMDNRAAQLDAFYGRLAAGQNQPLAQSDVWRTPPTRYHLE